MFALFYSELVNFIIMSRLMLLGILLLNLLVVVFGDKYCLENEKPVRLESRL